MAFRLLYTLTTISTFLFKVSWLIRGCVSIGGKIVPLSHIVVGPETIKEAQWPPEASLAYCEHLLLSLGSHRENAHLLLPPARAAIACMIDPWTGIPGSATGC